MEVPPGRLEASASGGREALISLLAEAESRKLNGLLAVVRPREDAPAEGIVVFHDGNGRLASHTWRETVDGPKAVAAILRDGVNADASLELRSYDHRGSTVRVDQLESAHPQARIDGLPDVVSLLAEIESDEHRARRRAVETMTAPDVSDVHEELRSVKDGVASLRRQVQEARSRQDAPNGAVRRTPLPGT